jgi:hypothetical protein
MSSPEHPDQNPPLLPSLNDRDQVILELCAWIPLPQVERFMDHWETVSEEMAEEGDYTDDEFVYEMVAEFQKWVAEFKKYAS